MSNSRVIVGLPIDSSGGRLRGGVKWAGQARSRQDQPRRTGPAVKTGQAGSAIDSAEEFLAAPNTAAGSLAFLSARHFLALVSLSLAAVLLVWFLVQSNHVAVVHSYEISDLTQQKLRLTEINRQLNTELARVSSLAQLEETARHTLGLVTPQQGQIVVID
jgi:cell division protein FtsB